MHTTTLAAFLALDLLLVLTPGADWAYAIAAGLRDRSIVPAVAGLIAGYAGYTLLAVGGLVLIVARSPGVLTALTAAGAAYLMWLGGGVLRRPAVPAAGAEAPAAPPGRTLLRGVGVSGLNPKALLFYFALFPQFVDPAHGWPVAAQTALLGVVHMVSCTLVYLAVGALARTVLRTRPAAARAVTRTSGAAMIAIGALLLLDRLAP
ncbi:LysE family translocator [Streptomyces sp. NPDC047002]|uniref:LysE family translocator n=1 Tax=Streptomyces sp. NPDC047002 TaxID=3155475 RepID=UPI003454956D